VYKRQLQFLGKILGKS